MAKKVFERYFGFAFYSFPIQLLLLQVKKHIYLLFFWIILFAIVFQSLGESYGVPLLLLEPEYLGRVNFLSYLILGFAMGGFFMAWNMSLFVLNSYRFEFLASLSNPFIQFCFNNSLIPLVFSITYLVKLVHFQHTEMLLPGGKIALSVCAVLLGNFLDILFTGLVFSIFNKDVETIIVKFSDRLKASYLGRKLKIDKFLTHISDCSQWPVQTFLHFPFAISKVRKVDFYERELLDKSLYQHHRNALLFQILTIGVIIAFGKLMVIPIFRLPAMAAIFLLFSIVIVFFSFLYYWSRAWGTVVIIVIVLLLNVLTRFDMVVYKHQLYGLNYDAPKLIYSNSTVSNNVNKTIVDTDVKNTIIILNKWHDKMLQNYGEKKPKMIFINTAGGGLKATYWSFHLLQELEKQTGEKLLDHTVLMTGASGGMLGAAYFRELYLQHHYNSAIDYLDSSYLNDVGKDLLNSVSTSIVTNDIFYPWQKIKYKNHCYKKDRGYMFDLNFNENTHYTLSKLLTDYKAPEDSAIIPLMIVSSTIINDQRFLLFSPQGIAYLVKPYVNNSNVYIDKLSTDAVEYMRFFKDREAANVNFVDVLRTNATYPYIMPAVYLPTQPQIKALDAGLRDNTGIAVAVRFYSVFKDWIDANTSGVVFVSLRVDNKFSDLEQNSKSTYLSELFSPIGSIFNNFRLLQNYNDDMSLAYLVNSGIMDINELDFNYDQADKNKKISMSWHLTNNEKAEVKSAFHQENNKEMLQRLKMLLH